MSPVYPVMELLQTLFCEGVKDKPSSMFCQFKEVKWAQPMFAPHDCHDHQDYIYSCCCLHDKAVAPSFSHLQANSIPRLCIFRNLKRMILSAGFLYLHKNWVCQKSQFLNKILNNAHSWQKNLLLHYDVTQHTWKQQILNRQKSAQQTIIQNQA